MDAKTMAIVSLFISAALLIVATVNYMEAKKLRDQISAAKKCTCDDNTEIIEDETLEAYTGNQVLQA